MTCDSTSSTYVGFPSQTTVDTRRGSSAVRERGVTRAGAITGALAAVTAVRPGLPAALLFLISSNLFDTGWASYPGLLTQEAILHLPIGATSTEVMRAATAASMRSLPKARYAVDELNAVRQAKERRRGVVFDKPGTAVVLNLLSADGLR